MDIKLVKRDKIMGKGIFDLSGKVALVTAGGHGLGREYCEAVAEFEADVACNDIDKALAQETVELIRRHGHRAIAIQADVSKQGEIESMVSMTLDKFGTIDILFCNAGITTHPAAIPFHDLKVEEWDRVMNLNLRGTFLCMRAVLPIMLRKKTGSIIITTSVSGVAARIQRDRAAYGASKAGLIGLTRHTAVSYAKEGIRINAIAPGWHSTNSLSLPNYKELEKFYAASNPMGRVAAAREIKGLAVYLASDASSYVTGQVFIEDGGETA